VGVTTSVPPPRTATDAAWARLRLTAWATLVANIAIVVTGGVVRLTGSGLGCPTWPRCTEDSFTPHGALTYHSAIEFGNRLITFVLVAVAIATFLAAYRVGRRGPLRLALLLGLGVPAQAVLGGVTVLVDLNPWVVAGHLLLSMAMISAAVLLLRRVYDEDRPRVPAVPLSLGRLAALTYAAGWAVLYAGTVVTGSGPYAGDADSPRNGLDPRGMSQLHADLVFLFVGLTIGLLLALHAVGARHEARRAAAVLLVVELAQGLVGFVQYFTGLPVVVVGLHLLGSALVAAAMTWALVETRVALEQAEAPAT
jgi:cytochrome c oxidase assembly protein subunit 15